MLPPTQDETEKPELAAANVDWAGEVNRRMVRQLVAAKFSREEIRVLFDDYRETRAWRDRTISLAVRYG
jgi:hypothetical protein